MTTLYQLKTLHCSVKKNPESPPFVFKMADKTSKIASMCVTPYSSVPYCSLTREYDSWLNGLQKIAQKLYWQSKSSTFELKEELNQYTAVGSTIRSSSEVQLWELDQLQTSQRPCYIYFGNHVSVSIWASQVDKRIRISVFSTCSSDTSGMRLILTFQAFGLSDIYRR